MLGEKREYLTIKILHNDMTVMVPCENAGVAGLRRVIDEETVKKVLAVLQDDVSEMPKNWNRRFKHNRDKIKTGDIYELAEVVRNLAIREAEKGLSTGEKQMFTRAKKILASELMYALEMDEEEAEEHLDDLLAESADGKVAVAAVPTDQGAEAHAAIAPGGRARLVRRRTIVAQRLERLAQRPKAFVVLGGRPMLDVERRRAARRRRRRADRRRAAGGRATRRRARSACPAAPTRSHSVRAALAAARRRRAGGRPRRGAPAGDARALRAHAGCRCRGRRGRRDRRRAGDRHDQGGRRRGGVVSRTLDRAALWAVQTPQVFRADALRRALDVPDDGARGRDRRRVARRARGRHRARRRVPAREPQGHDAARPARRRAAPRASADADRLPRASAPGRRRAPTAERYFTAANAERYREAAAERGIAELGVAEHVYRFAQSLDVWQHPFWRDQAQRRHRRLLRVRARGDRPAAGHRGRLRPRPRGPHGDAARRPRLGLRRRLGALPRATHAVDHDGWDVWAVDARTPTRSGGATSRRSARRRAAGMFDILAHPDLVKVWGGERPRPDGDLRRFYELADGGDRRVAARDRGLDRRPAQAGRRALPGPAFLEMCLEAGCPIALSSDAHVPEHLGYGYDQALELLERRRRDASCASSRAASAAWSRSADASRTGIGYDSHRLAAGRPLILGGVDIPHERGLDGHSDADVLTHAIIDALLGAAGLGDIGQHFPDTDDRWRGRRLDRAAARRSWRSSARPASQIRQRRRDGRARAPEARPAPRRRCASASPTRSSVTIARVNVKATTGEGMGFVGRGEGAAALAIADARSVRSR